MASNTNPSTFIITDSDPALYRAYGTKIQGTLPPGVNANIFITNDITNEYVTALSGGGQAYGPDTAVQFAQQGFLASSTKLTFNANTSTFAVEGSAAVSALLTDVIRYANGEPWVFGSGNGTVGGGNLTLQYNNAGNFGGVTGTAYNSISGAFTLGNIANVKITGGTNNQIIVTDGAGNLSFVNAFTLPAGSNTQIQFNDAGVANASANLAFNKTTNTLTTNNISVVANVTADTVTANIIGTGTSNLNGNVILASTLTLAGNASIGNISTGIITATGNVTGAAIAVTGNAAANNINVSNAAVIQANLTANNISTRQITANGNVALTGASIALGAVGNISITGGSAGQYLQTDGAAALSWSTVSLSNINNGTSNVSVASSGNVSVSVSGNTNILTVTGTGANIAGTLAVTGNASVSNFTAVAITGTGNVALSGANVSLGAVANLHITGGTANQFLQTDGAGTLTWATVVLSNISNGTSNVAINTSGGNVTVGAAGNANVVVVSGAGASITGTLNVSGVTTLSANLSVTGNLAASGNVNLTGSNVSLGAVGNLHITGGTANQFLQTDGAGAVTWATAVITAPAANTQVYFSDTSVANNIGNSANFTFDKTTNTLTVANTVTAPNAAFTGSNVWLGAVGNLHITGGTSGQILQTDGNANLSWANFTVDNIANGTSNIRVAAGGNAAISIGGSSNLYVFGATSANLTGNANVSGFIVAGGNVSGSNINASANLVVSGEANVTGNLSVTGFITSNANVTGSNLVTAGNAYVTGFVQATGNVSGANLVTTGIVQASGNVSGLNISGTGNLTITGNGSVTGNFSVTANANLTRANITTLDGGFISASANTTATLGNVVTLVVNGVSYRLLAV